MAPDLVGEFVRAFNEQVNQMRRHQDQRREGLVRERKDLERRIDALLEAFSSGALKGPSVQNKLDALESRQSAITTELAGLQIEPVRLHPNLAELYRQKVADLHGLLGNDATRTAAVEVIRSLVAHVALHPMPNGALQIELVGEIANMVNLAQNPKENGPDAGSVHGQFSRSIKVVAGVGFEPTTFRL